MPILSTPAVPINVAVVLFDSARPPGVPGLFGVGVSGVGLPASEVTDGYWYLRSIDRHRAAGRSAAFVTRDPACPPGATRAEERAWDQGYAVGMGWIERAYQAGRAACLADLPPTPPGNPHPEPEATALKGAWLDGYGDAQEVAVRNMEEIYEAYKMSAAIETYLRTYESIPSDDALVGV